MCEECDGLGEFFSFDPKLLVPDPSKSFAKGAFELLGGWKDISRWKRSIYSGVAEKVEQSNELPEGTLLETPWEDLDPQLQELLLWGTGDEHITFTWAWREVADQIWRQLRGHYPRAAFEVSQQPKQDADSEAGKVHEYDSVSGMLRPTSKTDSHRRSKCEQRTMHSKSRPR